MKAKAMWLICLLIGAFVGFLLGFFYGFESALKAFVKEASKFINIDEVLIREYLARAGIA